MEQYAMYLRKSRADIELEAIGEMETLARHEKVLLDIAKKLKLPVTKIYKEIVSGETIEARPVVQQLIDEVERGLWTGVLVMEIERLAGAILSTKALLQERLSIIIPKLLHLLNI